MVDLDGIDARREVRKPSYGRTQVCIAEDDFDAMVREFRALRARVAEMERDARLGAAVREAIDATHAPVEETEKSGLVYVTIEYDEWRCRLMLRMREWMRMYPYVAAQALCDVLMKAMASVLSQEDTDDGDA